MIEEFILRAFLGGIGVAAVAGPLGCFVVWRRMAYFGDALAHSALLGVALGALLGTDFRIGILGTCLAFALLLFALQRQGRLATDTLLGILSHAALSLGLVALAFITWLRIDLMAYLFGDVLSVSWGDVAWIWIGGATVLAILFSIWERLLAATVQEELARAEGVPIAAVRLVFMLLIALTVAVAMKIVGVLLIVSMLILPAAAARQFARSPEAMAGLAAVIGALAVAGGIAGSMTWNTPSGPSIVVAATVLFAASLLGGWLLSRRAPAT